MQESSLAKGHSLPTPGLKGIESLGLSAGQSCFLS